MLSNRRGTSTAFCVLAVSSQSETTPSTWRMENHTVNEVCDNDSDNALMRLMNGFLKIRHAVALCLSRFDWILLE